MNAEPEIVGDERVAPGRRAVVDLLGMLSLAELLAFDRMAADARLAPDLHCRAVLSEMAAREIMGYRRLADRLVVLGADPEAAMTPFVAALRDYHAMTEPSDWYEALAKAYIGDSFADDLVREAAAALDAQDRDLVLEVLHDSSHADFAAHELRVAIEADSKLASRMSMWARRLAGEALSQALRVAGERPSLAALLAGDAGDDGEDGERPVGSGRPAGGVAELLKRLTTAHTARMAAVGLNT